MMAQVEKNDSLQISSTMRAILSILLKKQQCETRRILDCSVILLADYDPSVRCLILRRNNEGLGHEVDVTSSPFPW